MSTLIHLRGQIERITFQHEAHDFVIAKVKVYGERDLVTVVGNLPGVSPGELLELSGVWVTHPKFGSQFKVLGFRSIMPATVVGIEKYLGSGLIKGIGPIMAKRLVTQFGVETLEIIDTQPERLAEVEGIGKKRIRMIREAWEAQKTIREVMIFLQGHGISASYAAKIFREYGPEAITIVKENPYRLATEIWGIGFVTADKIARSLGLPPDALIRVEAGLLYVLHQLTDEGHVYYPYEQLIAQSQKILGVEREVVVQGFAKMVQEKQIIVEDLNTLEKDYIPNNKAVYLAGYYTAEQGIAQKLSLLLTTPSNLRPIDAEKALAWAEQRLHLELADKQRLAIRTAIQQKVMILTGGPGTGKTTIVRAILEIYRHITPNILLGAPTGRAAKRLSEATGQEAKTIHRLLEWNFSSMGFQRGIENPLGADVVIIDEASMIDTLLMYHLLKAIPPTAVCILVGDVHQLPSVGPGNVLQDLIASGTVPVVELQEIFRQALGSLIVTNAHRINRGEFPEIPPPHASHLRDFYFIEREDPEAAAKTILEMVTKRIPARFGLHPVEDIQVLTPMHRGILGAGNLNALLQQALNTSRQTLIRGGRTYKTGDKVMQIKNNYAKEIFNGDLGRIRYIDHENQAVTVEFEGRTIDYDFTDLEELVLAYAVSIHKSQGSEYPAVVIPIHTSHYILLQRNLIYTGITRAKKLVILVGTKKALWIAINHNKPQKRYTGLCARLTSLVGPVGRRLPCQNGLDSP